jgi:hypothetical protein
MMVNITNSRRVTDVSKTCQGGKNPACDIPKAHVLTLKVSYDRSLMDKVSDLEDWIFKVLTHAQVHFQHPSLPTKIQLTVVDKAKAYPNSTWTADDSIKTVSQYAKGDKAANLFLFMCNDPRYYGTVGIGYVGGVCSTLGYQVAIAEWRNTEAESGKVSEEAQLQSIFS